MPADEQILPPEPRRPLWRLDLAVLLALAVLTSLPFWFTSLDLRLQGLFYRPGSGWFLKDRFPWRALYLYGTWPGLLAGLAAAGVAAGSFFRPRWRHWRPHALFLVLALAVGPGLLVNGLFKDHWGRPRPRDVAQFGGAYAYQPLLVKGDSGRGKSFPCGHCSMGFYLCAFFFVWRRHRRRLAYLALAAGIALGLLLGIARMAAGAHFPSDVLWAAHLTLLPAVLLYYFVLRIPQIERAEESTRAAAHTHWVWSAIALVVACGILGSALLILKPVFREIRYAQPLPAAPPEAGALEFDLAAGPLTLTLTNLAGQAFAAEGQLQGFGLPWSTVHEALTDTPDGGWRLSLVPQGYFRELTCDLQLRVNPSAVRRLQGRVRRGDVRLLARAPGPRPEIEITLDRGAFSVADSVTTNLQVRRLPGGVVRYRIPAR